MGARRLFGSWAKRRRLRVATIRHKAMQELPWQNDHIMGVHKRRPIDVVNQVDVIHQAYFVLGAFEQGNAESRVVVPGWVEHAVCFGVSMNLRRNLLGMDIPAAYKLTQVQSEPGCHYARRGQIGKTQVVHDADSPDHSSVRFRHGDGPPGPIPLMYVENRLHQRRRKFGCQVEHTVPVGGIIVAIAAIPAKIQGLASIRHPAHVLQ